MAMTRSAPSRRARADGHLSDAARAPHGDDGARADARLSPRPCSRWGTRPRRRRGARPARPRARGRRPRRRTGRGRTRRGAGVAAEGVRVAEDAPGRVAEDRVLHHVARVRVVAEREELMPAVEAGRRSRGWTRRRRGRPASFFTSRAGLDDLADELVADDVAGLHGRDVAVDRCRSEPQRRTWSRGRWRRAGSGWWGRGRARRAGRSPRSSRWLAWGCPP